MNNKDEQRISGNIHDLQQRQADLSRDYTTAALLCALLSLLAWIRGNSKILAKIGNSVLEPLFKPVQTGEKRREIANRNA